MPVNKIQAIPMAIIDAGAIPVGYTPINAPNGLPHACTILRIINDSDIAIAISYDGTNDNDFILPNSVLQIEAQTNSRPNNKEQLFAQGTIVYVRSPIPGTGEVWVAGYYS